MENLPDVDENWLDYIWSLLEERIQALEYEGWTFVENIGKEDFTVSATRGGSEVLSRSHFTVLEEWGDCLRSLETFDESTNY